MAPAYENSPQMPPPLPVDPNCLHCHTTDVAKPENGVRNGYAGAPFAQAGIGCRACHGDPSAHLAARGHAPITNPVKLSAERRDSACIQCHLEGDEVVYRAGRNLSQFMPGDRLDDIAVYFVRASKAAGGARAASQYEALLQSACKRASGDRLTCTTCHDPHVEPTPATRVEFYRAKCLGCHNSLAATHHPEQQDCTQCHMPARQTTDISHEQVTDHTIRAVPQPQHNERLAKNDELVPVGEFHVSDRELGLAYAQVAQRGDRAAGARALELLTRAEAHGASDEQVLLNLGFLYQVSGEIGKAADEYERALRLDPYEPAVVSNMAVIEVSRNNNKRAISMLETLIDADAAQTSAGLNLAILQCRAGRVADAGNTVQRLEVLNPDSPALRGFLHSGCAALTQHQTH